VEDRPRPFIFFSRNQVSGGQTDDFGFRFISYKKILKHTPDPHQTYHNFSTKNFSNTLPTNIIISLIVFQTGGILIYFSLLFATVLHAAQAIKNNNFAKEVYSKSLAGVKYF